MPICEICGRTVDIAYTCKICETVFCSECGSAEKMLCSFCIGGGEDEEDWKDWEEEEEEEEPREGFRHA